MPRRRNMMPQESLPRRRNRETCHEGATGKHATKAQRECLGKPATKAREGNMPRRRNGEHATKAQDDAHRGKNPECAIRNPLGMRNWQWLPMFSLKAHLLQVRPCIELATHIAQEGRRHKENGCATLGERASKAACKDLAEWWPPMHRKLSRTTGNPCKTTFPKDFGQRSPHSSFGIVTSTCTHCLQLAKAPCTT